MAHIKEYSSFSEHRNIVMHLFHQRVRGGSEISVEQEREMIGEYLSASFAKAKTKPNDEDGIRTLGMLEMHGYYLCQ